MATTLRVLTAKSAISWDWIDSQTFSESVNADSLAKTVRLLTGSGVDQANLLAMPVQYTIAASGTQNVDLAGALEDFANQVCTFTAIKVLHVAMATNNTASSILVGNGTNPFINWITPSTGAIRVRKGGFFDLVTPDVTGYPVTAATGDILKITNEDTVNTAIVNVIIGGVGTAA